MNCRKYIFIILTLISCTSFAKKGHKKSKAHKAGPVKYYYTVPVEASPEWSYAIPECQEIAFEDYKVLKNKNNCQASPTKSETCLSRADIELRNPATNEKKSFGLNYVIYETKPACDQEREKLIPTTTAAPAPQ